ncbi:MAG: ATP-dependent Clp protease ATP-binding subunit ClpX, partial [Eubacteriales bacterium]|nr:ATP-dependent Clp protease ATP-binding subunit ClpX [Eubacteriales bacterium]
DRAIEMKIGARGLRSVMEDVMTEIMYSVPSDDRIDRVVITADSVHKKADPQIYYKSAGQNLLPDID